jgi:hypothetical protein
MARYLYTGIARDGVGNIIPSATISAYLSGTTTAASVYTASTGGTAVNSVTAGTDGIFTLYVDDTDYAGSQLFKLVVSKTGYTSKTYDEIVIYPQLNVPTTWSGFTRKLTMRPSLNAGYIAAKTKPTPVSVGAHAGYSMPIYNSDDEELFFREYVAGRWDGATDITISLICCLAGAETAGEDFRFSIGYECIKLDGTEKLSTSVGTLETEQNCAAAAQYQTFKLDFTLPAADVEASDHVGFRVRRIAVEESGANEVDGEVIVLDCIITYNVNKVYKTA